MSEHSCCHGSGECHGDGHCQDHDHDHAHAANGVENPGVLDALGRDPESGEVVLVMIEPRPWNGGETQMMQLQEKFNSYLSFALDGEMVEQIPQLAGVPVRIQLACIQEPPEDVVSMLDKVREQIAFQGIGLRVTGHAPESIPVGGGGGGCGSGCGCGA